MLHLTEIRTRYCESDALGHINNVSYFIYFEQARVDFMLDTGMVLPSGKFPFLVASLHCEYKKQIYIHQTLTIHTYVMEIGRSSFKLGHEIHDKDSNELLAVGEAVLVSYDLIVQQTTRLTDELRLKLENYVRIKNK
ncbi:acyl-CoA thioesterase [Paenibacillus naphthalenovorans]|uniref:acyl-CoA thioesterase n=1 Tax=Paenibacillus naphthalenovorans TaxID=162209 RepID=UPI0010B193B6|nr:thioesterase family protein [Paenibacillus naphthalenovorans]GCL71857.1 acyl-CoA thioesterase [Paenibacillus naphthalenovorans]